MANGITALVLTYNGERLLQRCLESLSFCDAIVVVDSLSTDKTVDIAKACGAKVIQRAWQGPGPQFQFALGQIESSWIFSLDQDEICSSSLKKAILKAVENSTESVSACWISRSSWYYDRFMKHSGWSPDYLLRLFRSGKMEVRVDGAHYSFHPLGGTQKIEGRIIHYPYENFAQHLEKLNNYAQQGADALEAKGKQGGLLPGILHGLGRFSKLYLVKLGFMDGRAGFINAVHGAVYAFLKYVRVEEGSWGFPYDHDE